MPFPACYSAVHSAGSQTTRARLETSAERRAAKLSTRLRHRALGSPISFRRMSSIESPPCTPTVLSPVPSNKSLHSQLRALLQRIDGSPSERALTHRQDESPAELDASPVCLFYSVLGVSDLMQGTDTYSYVPSPATVTN